MVWKRWSLYFLVTAAMAESALPEIQLDSVGEQLGFAGNFAGLSPYRLPSQFEALETASLVLSDIIDDATIFQSFATINGSIETYCQLADDEFILAGNFISINETTYNHIARFNSQSRQLSPLDQGLDGAVRSVYCTPDAVYVGGDFMAPVQANLSQYTGHAAVYANSQWSPLPWKGFNGPVYSIIPHAQQNAIIFGGQFGSTGDGQYTAPNASATTQMVNLDSSVTISSGNGASGSDPKSVVCSQAPWLLQDGNPGYWQAQFVFSIQPSKFRLSNLHSADGKNTRTFKQVASKLSRANTNMSLIASFLWAPTSTFACRIRTPLPTRWQPAPKHVRCPTTPIYPIKTLQSSTRYPPAASGSTLTPGTALLAASLESASTDPTLHCSPTW